MKWNNLKWNDLVKNEETRSYGKKWKWWNSIREKEGQRWVSKEMKKWRNEVDQIRNKKRRKEKEKEERGQTTDKLTGKKHKILFFFSTK